MSATDIATAILLSIGGIFFFAGTVGLLRFPDIYTRLHALTKVDNLGLGFVVLGLLCQTESWATALKLLLIWVLVLAASAAACYLIAEAAQRAGIVPARNRGAAP
jgi:multicomponent Na+:H+ antiporter subunit G